jgi:putative cell wall-binding protein
MDRPARRGLTAGALGLVLSASWLALPSVAAASSAGRPATHGPATHASATHGPATHAPATAQEGGTRDLSAKVRAILRHRLPDALVPEPRASRLSTHVRRDAAGTFRVAANWSGEVELESNVTLVSASWKVPSVVPSTSLQFAATWIGIGGFTGTTLIQTGTIEVTATGRVGYAAWVEVLPQAAWTLTSLSTPGGTPSLVVAPGDVMRASVTLAATDEWQVTIANATAKWTYSHSYRYSVKATSADWVTERPTIYTSSARKTVISTLADYGSTRFSHLESAVNGGVAATPPSLTPVRMENGGAVISAPGPLSSPASPTGETFANSYLAMPSRVYAGTVDGTAAAELEHQFTYRSGTCPSSPTSGRAVVLATDRTYSDALASTYLASYLESGTLLTSPTSLSAATLAAIRDEGITHVYLVGGQLAVSTAVVSELEGIPAYACGGTSVLGGTVKVQVTRIAGANRYSTALDIAETSGATPGRVDLAGAYAGVNPLGGPGAYNATEGNASASAPPGALITAVLATGSSFQDAEAAGALAYAEHLPVLLTTPSALSAQVLAAIEALHIQQVIVMGGQLAVSDAVVQTLEAHGVSALRIAGADDTETAIELARCEVSATTSHAGLGWAGTGSLTVTRGDFYSDGLAGAVVAADGPGDAAPEPLLLTASPTSMGSYLPTFLATAGTSGVGGKRVTTFTILGGPLAVSQTVANTMVVALLGQ